MRRFLPTRSLIRFAQDSALEGDGFESPVPQQIRSRFRESSHFSHDGLTVSRPVTGTSNPSPSREESGANLTSSIRDIATVTEGAALRRVAVRMKFLTWTDNTCYASRLRRIARGTSRRLRSGA